MEEARYPAMEAVGPSLQAALGQVRMHPSLAARARPPPRLHLPCARLRRGPSVAPAPYQWSGASKGGGESSTGCVSGEKEGGERKKREREEVAVGERKGVLVG